MFSENNSSDEFSFDFCSPRKHSGGGGGIQVFCINSLPLINPSYTGAKAGEDRNKNRKRKKKKKKTDRKLARPVQGGLIKAD